MTPSRRAVVAWLLALALVAAQALGLAHRSAHGLAAGLPAPAAGAMAAAPTAFDAHEPASVECRLLDQAAHLDGLRVAAPAALPPRAPAPRTGVVTVHAGAGGCAAYLARGPPGAAAGEGRLLG